VAEEENPKTASVKEYPHAEIQRRPLLAAVFFIIVSVSSGFAGGWFASRNKEAALTSSTSSKQQVVSSESQLISQIVKDVGPSVVSVDVTGQGSPTDSFFGRQSSSQESAGTGFIISSGGIILTNRHVVPAGTTSISVTLANGTTLSNVTVIGRTANSDPLDIAFLKINDAKGQKLTPVTLGDSSKVQVGEKVVAIGNALGQFQNTVTEGIISGYGRSVQAGDQSGGSSETLQDLFQTDAAINEGNSGGPLVNLGSQVIGINTAIAGNAQNIGFSIPINDVQGVIKSVLNTGKLERPYLGVRYISLTDDIAAQYKLSVKRGAYIAPGGTQAAIISGSPADKAGLKEGDIITKVDSTSIDENNSLTSVFGRHSVGDTVSLTVVRDGKTQTIQATLAAAPQN
jgi:serine protease Do